MRTTKLLTLLCALAAMVGCAAGGSEFADPVAKVNPKIGSGGHGHV